MSTYSVYLVRCSDGSLYTGIATDVARRITEHQESKRGARFLRGKGPLTLIYEREIGDRSLASKIECRVKRLPKAEKTNSKVLSKRIGSFVAQLEEQSARSIDLAGSGQ